MSAISSSSPARTLRARAIPTDSLSSAVKVGAAVPPRGAPALRLGDAPDATLMRRFVFAGLVLLAARGAPFRLNCSTNCSTRMPCK